ncbi:MAG TPA: hypothetical protein VM864_07195 [Pyrinomonadaceae bacterium]|jgi:hypothetical protein|nr:hypothetical protein [Pyrinomonadaceae bacterium]
MPVIGRLDSQVNDVLIEPVGNRRPRDGRDERAAHDGARPAATGEAPRDGAGAAGDDARDDSREDARRAGQLPVWLL